MYKFMKKHLTPGRIASVLTAAAIAMAFAFPALGEPQQQEGRELPTLRFREMSLGKDMQRRGENGVPYNRFISDLFYIDYPVFWYAGTDDYCPLMFYYKDPDTAVSKEFVDFTDQNLNGDPAQVAAYVESGGINGYLQQVLGEPITSEYRLVPQEKEDIVLVYSLERNGRTEASIVVWTYGALSIRDEIIYVSYEASKDKGSISIFPEWDETDFSSLDAIGAYIQSGNLNLILEPYLSVAPVWTASTYKTDYHDFYYCVGEADGQRIAVYIPVTPADHKNWIVIFDVDKNSKEAENAFDMRETFIQTFQALK